MHELDTIGDFVDHLDKKAKFIRSGRLLQADCEENLLTYYAIRINENGEHDFVNTGDALEIDSSHYARFTNDARYVARKEADGLSYLWDELIETLASHMLDGTSVTFGNYKFKLEKNELGVRYMALERRFLRRGHAESVKGALEAGATEDIFFRMMIRPAGAKYNENAYFILTFRYKESSLEGRDYKQYRMARTNAAHIYANGILVRFPHLKRVIGIAREPPGQPHGVSEDNLERAVAADGGDAARDRKILRLEPGAGFDLGFDRVEARLDALGLFDQRVGPVLFVEIGEFVVADAESLDLGLLGVGRLARLGMDTPETRGGAPVDVHHRRGPLPAGRELVGGHQEPLHVEFDEQRLGLEPDAVFVLVGEEVAQDGSARGLVGVDADEARHGRAGRHPLFGQQALHLPGRRGGR